MGNATIWMKTRFPRENLLLKLIWNKFHLLNILDVNFCTLFSKFSPFFWLVEAYGCLQNWEQRQPCSHQPSSIKKHKVASFLLIKWWDKKKFNFVFYRLPHVSPGLESPSHLGYHWKSFKKTLGIGKQLTNYYFQCEV